MSLENHIAALQERHTNLEDEIRQEEFRPAPDPDHLHRLKVAKLHVKEEIETARSRVQNAA